MCLFLFWFLFFTVRNILSSWVTREWVSARMKKKTHDESERTKLTRTEIWESSRTMFCRKKDYWMQEDSVITVERMERGKKEDMCTHNTIERRNKSIEECKEFLSLKMRRRMKWHELFVEGEKETKNEYEEKAITFDSLWQQEEMRHKKIHKKRRGKKNLRLELKLRGKTVKRRWGARYARRIKRAK